MKLVSLLFTPVYYLPEKPISHQLSQRECFYLLVVFRLEQLTYVQQQLNDEVDHEMNKEVDMNGTLPVSVRINDVKFSGIVLRL